MWWSAVDNAQYENRVRNFDFDIITDLWPQSLSPGNEQRDFWSSAAADTPGSNNTVGIKNPAVDALIDQIIFPPRIAILWWPRPRRSTACCCGIFTWFRNSPTLLRATRGGINSAVPIRCRNMAFPDSRLYGGGTQRTEKTSRRS